MRFFFCERLMFNTAWHDKQFSWTQNHMAITQTYCQASFENQKEVIRVIVFVPDKFALNFYHHNIVAIEAGDGSLGG